MTTYGVTLPPALAAALSECYSQGGTGAVLAWSGRARAAFLVADSVRPTSAAAVAELRRLGLEPVLLTGDSAGAAMAVADQVGISSVIADALPEGKVEVVRRYQQAGHVVAMVGDGVNDAARWPRPTSGWPWAPAPTSPSTLGPDPGALRSDRGGGRDPALPAHPWCDPRQPVLGLRLQLRGAPLAAAGLLNPMLAGRRWRSARSSWSPTACVCAVSPGTPDRWRTLPDSRPRFDRTRRPATRDVSDGAI